LDIHPAAKNKNEIVGVIFQDLAFLRLEYNKRLSTEITDATMKEKLKKEKEPTMKMKLNSVFIKYFDQMNGGKKTIFNKLVDKMTNEKKLSDNRNVLIYKFLYTGEQMQFYFKESQSAWAFQQFSANLFVHSLRFNESDKKVIQEIAKNWTIGMPENLLN
jgi:hypothetical protein